MKYLISFFTIAAVVFACTASKTIDETVATDNQNTVTEEDIIIAPLSGPDTTLWVAPAETEDIVNPMDGDADAIAEGMMVYKRNCRSCHGKLGNGAGVGAADLTTHAADFTSADFWSQSDGSIYWKIEEGRNDMDSFKGELDEDQLWQVIAYLKATFKPQE